MSGQHTDDASIRELALLSEDELYKRLAIESAGLQALPLDPRDILERGRRLFEAQSANVRDAICGNARLKTFATGKNDTVEVAMEILKLLSALVIKISPVPLSVLLAKKGLKNLCENKWSNDST